jgi:cell division protein ZapA (FtsZ GTPase activity inhibitor)
VKVQISIRGRRYTLRSDEDEDLPAIAAYVDRKMTEIAEHGAASRRGGAAVDEPTLAILAALNIASELERLRRQVDEDLASVDRDLASTALLLEAALPGEDGDDNAVEP